MLKPALTLLLLLPATTLHQQTADAPKPADAPIPAADAAKVNPVKATPVSLAKARKMYGYDCAMCHGANGNGKGDVGAGMNLKDYTDPAALRDLTDGQLFYIIQNGRGQMSGEAGRQNEQEIWNMVILVRSFAHK
ncbi:MAG TPA: c-type cytochrome [Acidobacteriaceae bacterium]|nr:c-type cytochrome [Acidobacteriaceae bacterium]